MRATAFEPRFRCGVAWGAMYDFGAVARGLVADGTHKSVHHLLPHLQWVTGIKDTTEILAQTDRMTLNGILDRIKCPILVAHGENDRQVPLDAAKRVIAEAVNSKGRELKVHTVSEGGSEHCSVDNISMTTDYIAHWIARTLNAQKELA